MSLYEKTAVSYEQRAQTYEAAGNPAKAAKMREKAVKTRQRGLKYGRIAATTPDGIREQNRQRANLLGRSLGAPTIDEFGNTKYGPVTGGQAMESQNTLNKRWTATRVAGNSAAVLSAGMLAPFASGRKTWGGAGFTVQYGNGLVKSFSSKNTSSVRFLSEYVMLFNALAQADWPTED